MSDRLDFSIHDPNISLNDARFLCAFYLDYQLFIEKDHPYPDLRDWPQDLSQNPNVSLCDREEIARNLPSVYSPKYAAIILFSNGKYDEFFWFLSHFADLRSNLVARTFAVSTNLIDRDTINNYILDVILPLVLEKVADYSNNSNLVPFCASLLQLEVLFPNCELLLNVQEIVLQNVLDLVQQLPMFVNENIMLPRVSVYLPFEMDGDTVAEESQIFLEISSSIRFLLTLLANSNCLDAHVVGLTAKLLKDVRGYCMNDQQFQWVSNSLLNFLEKAGNFDESFQEDSVFERITEICIRLELRDKTSWLYREIAIEAGSNNSPSEHHKKSLSLYKLFLPENDSDIESDTSDSTQNTRSSPLIKFISLANLEQFDNLLVFFEYCKEKYSQNRAYPTLPPLTNENISIWNGYLTQGYEGDFGSNQVTQDIEFLLNSEEIKLKSQLIIEENDRILMNYLVHGLNLDDLGQRNGIQINLMMQPADLLIDLSMRHESVEQGVPVQQGNALTFTSVEESDLSSQSTVYSHKNEGFQAFNQVLSYKLNNLAGEFFEPKQQNDHLNDFSPTYHSPQSIPRLNLALARSPGDTTTSNIQSIPLDSDRKVKKRKLRKRREHSRPHMKLLEIPTLTPNKINNSGNFPMPLLSLNSIKNTEDPKYSEIQTQTSVEEIKQAATVTVSRDVAVETLVLQRTDRGTVTDPRQESTKTEISEGRSFFHVQPIDEDAFSRNFTRFLHVSV